MSRPQPPAFSCNDRRGLVALGASGVGAVRFAGACFGRCSLLLLRLSARQRAGDTFEGKETRGRLTDLGISTHKCWHTLCPGAQEQQSKRGRKAVVQKSVGEERWREWKGGHFGWRCGLWPGVREPLGWQRHPSSSTVPHPPLHHHTHSTRHCTSSKHAISTSTDHQDGRKKSSQCRRLRVPPRQS